MLTCAVNDLAASNRELTVISVDVLLSSLITLAIVISCLHVIQGLSFCAHKHMGGGGGGGYNYHHSDHI